MENGAADLCRDDPGDELTAIVDATVRGLTEIWTGDSDARTELAAGRVCVIAPDRDARRLWDWIGRSMLAPTRAVARRADMRTSTEVR